LLVHRRKAENQQRGTVTSTPNIYATSNDNAGVEPRSSLYHDHTLIDNDLYQGTTTRPAAEATSNMVELSPTAAPVYAMVHKPRPTNAVDQSQASAPAAPPRPSRDYDTTLIDNDLYE